jgi:hypothetical protein
MAYVTGSAADMTALLTALRNACTANGWTLAGEVLHRGNVYMRTQVVSNYLTLLGGTGIDGSNNLTGAAGNVVRVGPISSNAAFAIVWPMTYHIFIGTTPDEVYLVANYNVDNFLWGAFGQSTVSGLLGAGVWFAASTPPTISSSVLPIYMTAAGGVNNTSSDLSPALFWQVGVSGATLVNGYVHHGLDGASWSSNSPVISAFSAIAAMVNALPNAWNSEAVLLPVQVWLPRSAGNKVSLIADLAHTRYLRIDNHNPGDIITIGSDSWMVFPFFKKNSDARNGSTDADHTGTFGWAIRYDGP